MWGRNKTGALNGTVTSPLCPIALPQYRVVGISNPRDDLGKRENELSNFL